MKNTKTVTENRVTNNIDVIGKPFAFVINNDEQTEKTEKASMAFIEWIRMSQNSRKYIDRYGIIPCGWCVDLSDVINFIHVATAQDAITGGVVDVIYLIFENSLLNRFVYIDHTILERGTILLPIDDKIEYIPFSFKYVNSTRKRATKKQSTTEKTTATKTKTATDTTKTPTKTQTKTQTKTSTPKTSTKTTKKGGNN